VIFYVWNNLVAVVDLVHSVLNVLSYVLVCPKFFR